ncbi:MAG TPA: metallophosphoesterase family protein [Rubricoccaceae bacterium]
MTLAVFSDVHANLPALEAVLADIDARLGRGEVDPVYCLVGYATWPNETALAVQERGIPTIAGNYDEGVGLGSDDCGCAYQTDEDKARGAESIAYTNAAVTDATRA